MKTPKITKVTIRKTGWANEWVVQTYTNEGRYPAADYFTDDKKDAQDTAETMLKDESEV